MILSQQHSHAQALSVGHLKTKYNSYNVTLEVRCSRFHKQNATFHLT